MRLVANCILQSKGEVLLLQKPRRGWWVAPGGKVEPGEAPYEAVMREFREETGLKIKNPELRGVFTVNHVQEDQLVDSWMLMTFYAEQFAGELLAKSEEGTLAWMQKAQIKNLPMAEGDRVFFDHILSGGKVLSGKYTYTLDFELLDFESDQDLFFQLKSI